MSFYEAREARKHAKFIEHSNTWAHKARKLGKNVKHAKHTSTQALQLPYMVEVDSWLYIYSDEILKWFVNHHINIFWFQIHLSFLSFRNWTLLWKTSADWLKSFDWGWSKNIKINSFTDHLLFFTLSLIFRCYLRLLPRCKWKQDLMHLYSTIFYRFSYKIDAISIIYYSCSKLFIEIILLPLTYAMRITWNNLLS